MQAELLREITASLTDALLAVTCFAAAYKLQVFTRIPVTRLWQRCFIFSGIAASLGSIYHGLFFTLAQAPLKFIWNLMVLALIVCSSYLIKIALYRSFNSGKRWMLLTALQSLCLVGAFATIVQFKFVYVIVCYGLSLTLVIVMQMTRAQQRGSRFLYLGFVLTVFGGALQPLRWQPLAFLSANDLFHIIQAGAMLAFYQAVKQQSLANEWLQPKEEHA